MSQPRWLDFTRGDPGPAEIAGLRFWLDGVRLQALLRKANFNPGQLRDEVGRWTSEGGSGRAEPASRRRVGRGGGTPAQQVRLDIANARAREATRRLHELEPTWQGPQSLIDPDSIEGRISHYEAAAKAAEARLAEVLPKGFGTYERYVEFGQSMRDGLRAAGYNDVVPMIRGSAVTGESFRTGEAFDVGRRSDYDVALASPTLMQRATQLGIPLREGRARTGPLSRGDLDHLGLGELAVNLRDQMDRPVNFMVYNSRQAVTRRGPSRPILGK